MPIEAASGKEGTLFHTLTVGGERIIDEGVFSAVVIMVIVTTMVTPPVKWSLTRGEQRGSSKAE